jgi:2-dehydropantoate 2-reductase
VFKVRACAPDQLSGPLEFVILAVKAQATRAALGPLVPLLAADGFVVSMQNGICEEEIAGLIGAERTLGCLVYYAADYQEPGHIQLASEHELYYGELDGRMTPRLRLVTDTLGAFMPAIPTDNIWGWKWTKMCFVTLYFAGALLDIPFHETLQRREYWPTFAAVVTEAVRVGYAIGHTRLERYHSFEPACFADGYTPQAQAVLDSIARPNPKSLKVFTGMQRDLMVRKRKTEVDETVGMVVTKARALGLSVPLHEEILRQIKQIEQGARAMGWRNIEELAAVHAA